MTALATELEHWDSDDEECDSVSAADSHPSAFEGDPEDKVAVDVKDADGKVIGIKLVTRPSWMRSAAVPSSVPTKLSFLAAPAASTRARRRRSTPPPSMSALAPGLSSATPAPAPVASPSALPAAPAPSVAPGWVEGYPNLTGYMAGDPNAGSKGWPQGPAHTWSHRPTRMHPSAPRPVKGADFCLACGRAHKVRNCTRKYQPWPSAACHNCGRAGYREHACEAPYIGGNLTYNEVMQAQAKSLFFSLHHSSTMTQPSVSPTFALLVTCLPRVILVTAILASCPSPLPLARCRATPEHADVGSGLSPPNEGKLSPFAARTSNWPGRQSTFVD